MGRTGNVLAALLALALAPAAGAQEAAPSPAPPAGSGEAPGLLRLGRIYLTPSLRITSIGVDTNVFYTATDRRTDFIAHGGPGLEMVVPLRGNLKLRADGQVGYLYFARTQSQRRLTGGALGRLAYEGGRLHTGAQYAYARSFGRLGFEVDRRIAQETQQAQADLRYGLGPRFHIGLRAFATRSDLEGGQEFFGADPRANLSRDTYGGAAALGYALTPKTSLVLEADHQADRFALASGRDTDSNRVGGGIVVTSTTYLSGRAMAGARSIRVRALPEQDRIVPWAGVDLAWHFGPRTRLLARYSREVSFSAFAVAEDDLPTLTTEGYGLRLEKGLWRNLDLWLHGGFTRLATDAPVLIDTGDGPRPLRRDDEAWEAGADLGYAIRSRLRIGLAATWSERRSPVRDLGVEGLLLGATVTFVPK